MLPMRRWIATLAASVILTIGIVSAGATELVYFQNFTGPNGSSWPAPWIQGSSHVTVQDLQGGRGRLNGDPAFVARMLLPDFAQTDVEVTVTFEFEDVANQGIGFYVRQNGGTLREYVPHGHPFPTAVADLATPERLDLSLPAPHPVTGRASFRITLPEPANAELRVFDSSGRLVARPHSGTVAAGVSTLAWDPVDRSGHRIAPGVYFVRLTAQGRHATRRIVIAH